MCETDIGQLPPACPQPAPNPLRHQPGLQYSTQGAGVEGMQCGGGEALQQLVEGRRSHKHTWRIKAGRDTRGASHPNPRPDNAVQGSSIGKIKPHNFCLQNPMEVGATEETASPSEKSV